MPEKGDPVYRACSILAREDANAPRVISTIDQLISGDISAVKSHSAKVQFSFSVERIANGFVVRDEATDRAVHARFNFEVMRAIEELYGTLIPAEISA